jgi:hypothetical protein
VADLADAGYADFLPLFGKVSDAQAGAEAKVGMMAENTEVATLAGGCFWGMEQIIREIPGVIDTQVGGRGTIAARSIARRSSTTATRSARAALGSVAFVERWSYRSQPPSPGWIGGAASLVALSTNPRRRDRTTPLGRTRTVASGAPADAASTTPRSTRRA